MDVLLPLAVSAVVALLVGLMAWLGTRERLPRNAIFGIRTSSTTSSEAAWYAAHKAAAPHSYVAAVVFLAGGIASAVHAVMAVWPHQDTLLEFEVTGCLLRWSASESRTRCHAVPPKETW